MLLTPIAPAYHTPCHTMRLTMKHLETSVAYSYPPYMASFNRYPNKLKKEFAHQCQECYRMPSLPTKQPTDHCLKSCHKPLALPFKSAMIPLQSHGNEGGLCLHMLSALLLLQATNQTVPVRHPSPTISNTQITLPVCPFKSALTPPYPSHG